MYILMMINVSVTVKGNLHPFVEYNDCSSKWYGMDRRLLMETKWKIVKEKHSDFGFSVFVH